MRKSKAERAAANPHVSYRRLLIEQIIAEERQRENTVINYTKISISLMYGQVAIDVEAQSDDTEGFSPAEIKATIDHLIEQGFTPRTYQSREKADLTGKRGTVVGIKPVEGSKMFQVETKMDDENLKFTWRVFQATSARKGDRFEVFKNDKGFNEGRIIIDNGEQKSFDDIPF